MQFMSAPLGVANQQGRTHTSILNTQRFAIFQMTSGIQDAALAFQQMGFTTQGWSMAMRGASNNIGVMLSTMGSWAAIGGTIGLAVLPSMVSGLMSVTDQTNRARESLDKYLASQKQFAGVVKASFVEQTAPERRLTRLQAGRELIEKGQVTDATRDRMVDLYIREQGIPAQKIIEGIEGRISKEEGRLLESKRTSLGRIDPQTGLPVYDEDTQRRMLQEYKPRAKQEARESILAAEDGKYKKELDDANAQMLEAEITARRKATEDARNAARYIEGLKGSARKRVERELGLPAGSLPKRRKSEARAQDALEGLEDLGYSRGGVVGVAGSRPGPSDTVPAMLTPGEEVLTRSDPRHIANIGGYDAGGVVRRRLPSGGFTRSAGSTVDRKSYAERETARIREKSAAGELGYKLPSDRKYGSGGRLVGPDGTVYNRERIESREAHEMGRGLGMKPEEIDGLMDRVGPHETKRRMQESGGYTDAERRKLAQDDKIKDIKSQRSRSAAEFGKRVSDGAARQRDREGARGIGVFPAGPPAAKPAGPPRAATPDKPWSREDAWPYAGGGTQGPPDWQGQLRQRYQRRAAGTLGRIPGSARVGGVPPAAGIGSGNRMPDGGSGISGFHKKSPWEREPGVPEVIGPGAGTKSRAPLTTPGRAAHEGRAAEQGIYDAAESERRASQKKLDEDMQRYRDEAFAKRMQQLKDEARVVDSMRKQQQGLTLNRNAQL
jgi:hypothetical protein